MKKNLQYYFSIFLSVIDIGGAVWSGYNILAGFTKIKSGNPFENHVEWSPSLTFILYLIILVICIIAYFPIEKWRQKLRDEVEYDEQGINRKYGYFSKLSSAERKKIEEQKMIDAERILDSATMKKITHKGENDPQAAISKLIGLDNVKKDMVEMAARMEYEMAERKKDKTRPMEGMHMCFIGPPGTGKTTCARIMTGFLYKYGYIKKNQCVEIDGNFLKGMSPGESSKKTQMLIQKSIGGVLFIDEAYALLQKNGGVYGQEAIATIVKAMEDNRGDIVFIMAGYDKEMKELINSNPGITSRVKYYMQFKNYTVEELKDIFSSMANGKGLCISAEIMEAFEERIRYEIRRSNFGNARSVRNILEKVIDRHALNLSKHVIDESKRYILTGWDMPKLQEENYL